MALGYDVLILAYEQDYSADTQMIERIRGFKHLETHQKESFIIDLNDKLQYRQFTYSCQTPVDNAEARERIRLISDFLGAH